jgi:hypothetical protein
MADVATDLKNWSTTESSNAPAGTTVLGAGLDDNLRRIQATTRQDLASKGSDIASVAGTTDLGAVAGLMHDITGTEVITGFGTVSAGIWKLVQFDAAATITDNGTSLVLPGTANITTAAGTVGMFMSEGSGNWRSYGVWHRATGAVVNVNGYTEDTAPALGTDYVLTYDASASGHKKVLLGRAGSGVLGSEQASTSGTSIDFTSIPSWATRIEILLRGVSMNASAKLRIQLGDSGGVENTGYVGAISTCIATAAAESGTAGMDFPEIAASGILSGKITLTLEDSSDNTWVSGVSVGRSDSADAFTGGYYKATSAALDRVRITTVDGSTAFDAGAINIRYW